MAGFGLDFWLVLGIVFWWHLGSTSWFRMGKDGNHLKIHEVTS